MKQTSLFQSWIKTNQISSPSPILNAKTTCRAENDNSTDPCNATCTNQTTFKFETDDLDYILGNVFDKLDQTDRIGDEDDDDRTNNRNSTEALEVEKFIQSALDHKSLIYHPTANDFDRLDDFDLEQGQTWSYPLDFNLRLYQLNMVEQCLFKNTLVCLPTGLGKTFIGAVLMHNFLRWYPHGKVVFMAPTRPLVSQQLSACAQFIGYLSKPNMMIELTGSIPQIKRKLHWTQYRALFLTPHTLVNDLQSGICPAQTIRLLIFDEAHKATGNHVYCQILRLLTNEPYVHRQFRIVALSATPASDIGGVQTLIANLLISHLELRTEASSDVKPYTQHRHVETISVSLGSELMRYRDQLAECLKPALERLNNCGALCLNPISLQNPHRLAKFTIVKAREQWSASKSTDMGSIHNDFAVVICLLHALELLIQHGLRPVYRYWEDVFNGRRASESVRIQLNRLPIAKQLRSDLVRRFAIDNDGPNSDCLLSTQTPFLGGHPKLEKLKIVLLDHFNSSQHKRFGTNSTRAIVFSQFRDSVEEIMHMLKQLRPLIRPASFIGQSSTCVGSNNSPQLRNDSSDQPSPRLSNAGRAGISQRDQIRVMDSFRSGMFNTLVSTCVGEEGIDVGQVDLIVCFDAFKSPIRLMQRLGRTGRKRFGRIVMLLSEGREERNYAISMARTSSIQKALLEGGAYRQLAFYPHNPRMVPIGLEPKLEFAKFKLESTMESPSFSLADDSNDDHGIKMTKSIANLKLKSKNRRKNEFNRHIYDLHAKSIGLDRYLIRLNPIGPKRLLTQSHLITHGPDWPTLTDLYKTCNLAPCFLHIQSSNQNSVVGSSFSTRHLVSIFRLIELNRQNKTVLTFHALGLRTVDAVHASIDELLETVPVPNTNDDPADGVDDSHPTQSACALVVDKKCDALLENSLSTPHPNAMCKWTQSNHHDLDFNSFGLEFVHGPVTNFQFFDPKLIQIPCQLYSFNFSQIQTNSNRPLLTLECLQNAWFRLLAKMNKSNSNLPISIFPHFTTPKMDLKLSIEHSLLEALDDDDDGEESGLLPANGPIPTINDCTTTERIVFDERTNQIAKAFHIPTMTPCPVGLVDRINTNNASKLDFGGALALLENSSIHLDASSLWLDNEGEDIRLDPVMTRTPTTLNCTDCYGTNNQMSAIFTGKLYPSIGSHPESSSVDLFTSGNRLFLSEDLEDFIQPTQIHFTDRHDKKQNNDARDDDKEKEDDDLCLLHSNSSFGSQIDWSPINNQPVVHNENGEFETDLLVRPSSSPIPNYINTTATYPLGGNPTFSLTKSPSLHISHSLIREKSNKNLSNKSNFKTKRLRSFFMTQAQCTDRNLDDDQDFKFGPDQYDDSFIDDQTETMSEDDTSVSKPKVIDRSAMMAVYLQTIRSPQVRTKIVKKNSECDRLSEVGNSSPELVEDIFSQNADDDYELDSFCVGDDESISFEYQMTQPKVNQTRKRRRIVTGSQM